MCSGIQPKSTLEQLSMGSWAGVERSVYIRSVAESLLTDNRSVFSGDRKGKYSRASEFVAGYGFQVLIMLIQYGSSCRIKHVSGPLSQPEPASCWQPTFAGIRAVHRVSWATTGQWLKIRMRLLAKVSEVVQTYLRLISPE
jgi:hypothetical protein